MLALYRVILFIALHKSLRETVVFDHPNESCRQAFSCGAVSIFAACNLGFFSERAYTTREKEDARRLVIIVNMPLKAITVLV